MNDSLVKRILELKAKKKAIILAHNYQCSEVQDSADFVGDSLELSRKAAETDARVVVFCGVYFMAETAAILSPDKLVLIPDLHAGCPMVDMTPVENVLELKALHPQAKVVTYVNSSAAVKAESDYCCTSANAIQVVQSLPKDAEIIFVPDKFLGAYVAAETGRKLILYDGYCPTHMRVSAEDIRRLKALHPHAAVLVHPECAPDVVEVADEVLSTSGMCRYAGESSIGEFIVGTETALLYRLRNENPGKLFYPASEKMICPNMKLITLEKVLWSLEDMQYAVKVEENIRRMAWTAVDRMLKIGSGSSIKP